MGYWHAVSWVKGNFNQDINYQTLRSYLIRHFQTNKKNPRKSHYKKDDEADRFSFKLANEPKAIRLSLNKEKQYGINLYFQYESQFGMMTHTG